MKNERWIICFDLETDGPDPKICNPVEIAAVRTIQFAHILCGMQIALNWLKSMLNLMSEETR